jgi:hypothetical protein
MFFFRIIQKFDPDEGSSKLCYNQISITFISGASVAPISQVHVAVRFELLIVKKTKNYKRGVKLSVMIFV